MEVATVAREAGQGERRAEPRLDARWSGQRHVIRAAQIAFGGSVFDCVLLDTSPTGVRVHLLATAEAPEIATLRLGSGNAWTVQRRWQRGAEIGFKVVGIQGEQRAEPRLTAWWPDQGKMIRAAQIAFGGSVFDCVLLDTSRGGARAHLLAPAEAPELATLRLPGGDSWTVQRRWQRGEEVGFKVVEPGQESATTTGREMNAIRRGPTSPPSRTPAKKHRRRDDARNRAVLAVAALHWAAVASLAVAPIGAGLTLWLG
jgi:hypothetical protein